jgi:hypothetical protein
MVLKTVHTSPMMDNKCLVEVESVLRVRPLSKKEREDSVVLEALERVGKDDPATVILSPIHSGLASPISGSSLRARSESDGASNHVPQEYHFNHVLNEATSQDKVYYSLGLPIATSVMDSLKVATSSKKTSPQTHLLICMGVTNSGKTYTCFGGSSIPKRRASQDGLVPRLVDSLFSQSKHHGNGDSKGFAVQISVTQVAQSKGSDSNACQVQDLLAAPSDNKTAKPAAMSTPKRSVMSMARNFERSLPSPIRSPLKPKEVAELDIDDLKPTVQSCRDVTHAREILQNGLSASRKAAKGHQNHHLLITMQPVLNGTHFGDKIAILDMAGLEKEKRSQKRGKDSVANSNQEANAAVLHCLRTLIHNTNIMNGKTGPMDIMCPDDMASEISCVSQEKDPFQDRLKPVPFRQHKLTMLLSPLFLSSASAKVTLLLAAYPGHADYYEKKSLLQDFELLCGAALAADSARVRTGMGQNEETWVRSTFDEDDESEDDDSEDDESVDEDPAFLKAFPTTRRLSKRESSDKSLTLSASTDASENGMIPMPPAYAPTAPVLQKEQEVVRRQAHPSAPPADPVAPRQVEKNPAKQPAQNPRFVSDFPGVVLPSKPSEPVSERKKATVIVPSSMVGGPGARAPPFDEEEQPRHTVTAPALPNIKSPKRSREAVSPVGKTPLGRSSVENGSTPETESSAWKSTVRTLHSVKSTGKKLISTVRDKAMLSPSRELFSGATKERDATSSPASSSFPLTEINTSPKARSVEEESSDSINRKREDVRRQETRMQDVLNQKKALEKQETRMQDVLDQKKALERKCAELEKENTKLKEAFRETGRQQRQSKWMELDEEEFLKSRRERFEVQTLVKKPMVEHMNKVNYIHDIKNQWCTTNKQHFGLRFPTRFERATSLDIRDKTTEETEAASATNKRSNSGPKMSPVKLHFGVKSDARQNEIKERMRCSLAAKKQRGLSSLQLFAEKKKEKQPSFGKY